MNSIEASIVTPQTAENLLSLARRDQIYQPSETVALLAHTVATEPERIAAAERAAVVKALRSEAERRRSLVDSEENVTARTIQMVIAGAFDRSADAIENGADYA